MAEHQRIHPAQDPEAASSQRPTAPLFSRGDPRSDKGEPEGYYYPPHQRTIPYSYSKPPKRSCFRKCLCWTLCLIIIQIIVLAIFAGIIYLVFRPKLPKYSVDSLRITQLNRNSDNSLYASSNVNVTARNPNKKIGIYYESGSRLSVYFSGTKLCEGSLPKFYQGHRNTTVMNLSLTGQTDDATGLLQSIQAQQQTGSILLNLRGRVPVRLKLRGLKLMKWKFLVRCRLIVDSLSTDDTIRIKDSSCKFRFRF